MLSNDGKKKKGGGGTTEGHWGLARFLSSKLCGFFVCVNPHPMIFFPAFQRDWKGGKEGGREKQRKGGENKHPCDT